MEKEKQIDLESFKYSYSIASDNEKSKLLQSVKIFPERFDINTRSYVDYLWNRYWELYELREVDSKDVIEDISYKSKSLDSINPYISLTGLKLFDRSTGREIAQALITFQPSLKQLDVHYIEFKEPPQNIFCSQLLKHLFMHNYGEDINIHYD